MTHNTKYGMARAALSHGMHQLCDDLKLSGSHDSFEAVIYLALL